MSDEFLLDDILENYEDTPLVNTYTTGGRGRKQCPQCDVYVGVRNFLCPCGYDFSSKEHSELKTSVKDEKGANIQLRSKECIETLLFHHKLGHESGTIVYVPSGSCPIKLKSIDQLREWFDELVEHGFVIKGARYSKSAVKYFVRHFYDYHTQTHKECCASIDEFWNSVLEG